MFKKIIHWLHLWLGLTSGLVVLIVGLTGCLYVFINEIESVTEPYKYVASQPLKPFLPPSSLQAIAEKNFPGKKVRYVSYQQGRAAYVSLNDKASNIGLYIHPYTGAQLHLKDLKKDFDFFSFVLHGHRGLWMPYNIGRPIVDTAILIFIFLLLSGLVLWWPKNLRKANRNKSFTIKWSARRRRVNYDLHNVLGFYAMLILLVIAITGSLWGFEWFRSSFYRMTSGGKPFPAFKQPTSDTTASLRLDASGAARLDATASLRPNTIDSLFLQANTKDPNAAFFVFFPDKKSDPIQVSVNHHPGKTYDFELLYFDQRTLKPLPGPGVFKKRFQEASFADQLSRLNYDLHTGQVWGLPTKILAFFASLICASLPVTGFYIWWGRRKKSKRKTNCHQQKIKSSQNENVSIDLSIDPHHL